MKDNKSGLRIEVTTITPACAKDWLSKNQNFRALNETKANEYAAMMLRGEWQLNGETVKFDVDGNLKDGQHRLRAVIISGVTIQSLVVWGITDDSNIDTGKNRTLAQVLSAHGIAEGNRIASAIQYAWKYQRYGNFHGGSNTPNASRLAALEFINKNPSLIESYREVYKVREQFSKAGFHTALHFLFSQATDFELATEFYRALIKGAGLAETSPIYHLRERLIRERNDNRKMNINPYAGMVIKAWNAWVSHQGMKILRYSYEKEGLPQIEGFKENKRPRAVPPQERAPEVIKKGETE